jgi:hypothetical protein
MREAVEEAFWNFVDQKWRDALNIAVAEPPAWGAGSGGRIVSQDNGRKEAAKLAKVGAAAVHVTGVDGKRHRQGNSGQTCIFKEVMGCTADHPHWLCKIFGKLPAGEREKQITDNRLCPFCLLHDKDKPCGAKQRPVSVACTTPGCKGRHIQKLYDFLKDVFREENRVHVVHGDDGWEESDEAWELGEGEMMIVGTVQQDDEFSWQEVCNTWEAQDEEGAVGVYQVGVDQETSEPAAKGQCKKASTRKSDGRSLEMEDLLVEGEEQEYFLELLMRRASPERSKENSLAKGEACSVRDRRRNDKRKKAHKKNLAERAASEVAREEEAVNLASGKEKQVASNLAHNPEAKGRGLAEEGQRKKSQSAEPPATSEGECSG